MRDDYENDDCLKIKELEKRVKALELRVFAQRFKELSSPYDASKGGAKLMRKL